MAELGMDVEGMGTVPRMIMDIATQFETQTNQVSSKFLAVKWTGNDATNFHGEWQDQLKAIQAQCRTMMNDFGTKLVKQIEEQRVASGGAASAASGAAGARS